MDKHVLDVLVCPLCKNKVIFKEEQNEIWCKVDRLAFPINDGIPVMLEEQARQLTEEEVQ